MMGGQLPKLLTLRAGTKGQSKLVKQIPHREIRWILVILKWSSSTSGVTSFDAVEERGGSLEGDANS